MQEQVSYMRKNDVVIVPAGKTVRYLNDSHPTKLKKPLVVRVGDLNIDNKHVICWDENGNEVLLWVETFVEPHSCINAIVSAYMKQLSKELHGR